MTGRGGDRRVTCAQTFSSLARVSNVQNQQNAEKNENAHRQNFETNRQNDERDLLQTIAFGQTEPIDDLRTVRRVCLRIVEGGWLTNDTPTQIIRNHQQTNEQHNDPDQRPNPTRFYRHLFRFRDDRVADLDGRENVVVCWTRRESTYDGQETGQPESDGMGRQSDVGMENGVARPENRLTDERIRIVENVEIERINVEGNQDDSIEECHVLENQIGWSTKVLPLEHDDGDQTRQDAEDRQWENDSTVNTRICTTEIGQQTLGDVPKHFLSFLSTSLRQRGEN